MGCLTTCDEHSLLAGRASWCLQPLRQWWSRGKGPHTAAGSAPRVSRASTSARDCCWRSSRRKVGDLQHAYAVRRDGHLKSIKKIKTRIFMYIYSYSMVLSPQKSLKTVVIFRVIMGLFKAKKTFYKHENVKINWSCFTMLGTRLAWHRFKCVLTNNDPQRMKSAQMTEIFLHDCRQFYDCWMN